MAYSRVALAQMKVEPGAKESNLEKARTMLEDTGAEIVIFPELFSTGFDFDNHKNLAESVPGETTDFLREFSANRLVAGSLLEEERGSYHNTFVALGNGKFLPTYRKVHLFDLEKEYFAPGSRAVSFDYLGNRFAPAICYDLRFPELFRAQVKKGAEVILVSAEFPEPREEHFRALCVARAIENQCFVLACNSVGGDQRASYSGNSMVVSPWGEVIAEGGGSEEVVEAEIDLNQVKEVRENFPVLGDIKLGEIY